MKAADFLGNVDSDTYGISVHNFQVMSELLTALCTQSICKKHLDTTHCIDCKASLAFERLRCTEQPMSVNETVPFLKNACCTQGRAVSNAGGRTYFTRNSTVVSGLIQCAVWSKLVTTADTQSSWHSFLRYKWTFARGCRGRCRTIKMNVFSYHKTERVFLMT